MPLRPLNLETGQPKLDKELSKDEIAGRVLEEEDDRRMMVARGYRMQADEAALQRAQTQAAQAARR